MRTSKPARNPRNYDAAWDLLFVALVGYGVVSLVKRITTPTETR